MTFLAWSMLGGLVAVAIPILIHLFKRRSARRVDWGAMEFLLGSVVRRSRLMMIEELVLLMVRCVFVVAVVLTMARPLVPVGAGAPWLVVLPLLGGAGAALAAGTVLWSRVRARRVLYGLAILFLAAGLLMSAGERWRQIGRWSGGGQSDIALVLDGSGSMQVRQDGHSSFERIVAEARAMIEALPPGNGVSLVLAGPTPDILTPTPVADSRRLNALLDRVAPASGIVSMPDALQAAAMTLTDGTRPGKKIVLLTDTQSAGWAPEADMRWQALAQVLSDLAPGSKPVKPGEPVRSPIPILCRMLPLKAGFRNVAVTGIRFTRRAIGPDRPVGVAVTLENTGVTTVEAFPVRLDIDGEKELLTLSAGPLAAGMSETVTFRHRFRPTPGHGAMRGITVRADLADDLPEDNVSAAVAAFSPRLSVLVVDGNPGMPLVERPAGFLAIALAPYASTNVTVSASSATNASSAPPPFIDPRVVGAAGLGADSDFASCRVVVLADVPRLPAATAGRLTEFVEQGGSLLVALGSRCLPGFYNDWRAADGEPVIGARMRTFAVCGEKEAPVGIRASELTHPGLAMVADEKQSDLGEAAVRAYWQLAPLPEGGPAGVFGRFNTGDPFLVDRRLGRGRVMTVAAPLDAVSGNLPTLRSFVPLVHGLVCDLAAAPETAYLHVRAGNRLHLRLPTAVEPETATPHGLRGDYFAGRDFDRFAMTRVDGAVNFVWGGSPGADVPADDFSVRWTGSIRPRFNDPYTFYLQADDRARLWIDDQPVMTSILTEQAGKIQLSANRVYDIRVEMLELIGPASVRLEWSSPNQVREVVPNASLLARRPPSVRAGGGGDALLTGAKKGEYVGKLLYEKDSPVIAVDQPLLPGLYRLRVPESIVGRYGAMPDSLGRLPIAVAAEGEEGRFIPLRPNDLDAIGRHIDLVRLDSIDRLIAALTGNIPGHELTRHLAAAVLLILLIEAALTRWISAMRRTGEARGADKGVPA